MKRFLSLFIALLGFALASSAQEVSITVDISDRVKITDESYTTTVLQEGTTKFSPGEFMIQREPTTTMTSTGSPRAVVK